jgi:hypothetical protein
MMALSEVEMMMVMVVMTLARIGVCRCRQHRETETTQKNQNQNLTHSSLLNCLGTPKVQPINAGSIISLIVIIWNKLFSRKVHFP